MNAEPPRNAEGSLPSAAGGGGGPAPAPSTGLVGSFLDVLKKRATEAIVVAIIAAAAAAFWASWGYMKAWTKDLIIEATIEELSKDKNRLDEPIKKTLTRLRSSEIGALSVGNIVLTPTNPQYVLPIYMPKGHSGQISMILSGYLVPNQFYVRLVLPTGKNIDIATSEMTIDLAKYFQIISASEADSPESLILRPDYIKGLRTLTFQLVQLTGPDAGGGSSGGPKTEREIRIRYLALVSPTISMSSTP
jgi:hypothetical protein